MKTHIIISSIVSLAYASTVMACSSCGCTAQATSCSSQEEKLVDIVHTAEHAGQFKTLVAALGAADLSEALQGPGPFTVFAPTDKAFAALPAGTVESLLQPENKAKLQAILKYHVVAGKTISTDLMKYSEAKTLQGNPVNLSLTINNAKVIKVNAPHDWYWHSCQIAMVCNRGKESIAINLKDPASKEIVRKLVQSNFFHWSSSLFVYSIALLPKWRSCIHLFTVHGVTPLAKLRRTGGEVANFSR